MILLHVIVKDHGIIIILEYIGIITIRIMISENQKNKISYNKLDRQKSRGSPNG